MKKILKIIMYILPALWISLLTIHAGSTVYVQDDAGLLSQEDVEQLTTEAQKLSDTYETGVYIRTVNDDSAYDDIYTYTENFYTDHDLGYGDTSDGVLFLIAISSQGNSYDIYFPGNASEKKISTDGVNMAAEDAVPYLRDHEFRDACDAYLNSISEQLSYYEENGTAMEYAEENTQSSGAFRYILIFGIPAIIAFIVILVMLSMNKTKHKAETARQYIVKNGVHMNTIQDIFLYRTETREPLPKNTSSSSNFTSSSGGSHSGGHF